jgi:hypothetical protein
MKRNLEVTLLLVSICVGGGQSDHNQYEPDAIAVVAEHQLKEMKFPPEQLVCLSLPNYKDPKTQFLQKINGQGLHLRPGSSCWKPPRGFLLLLNDYQRGKEGIEVRVEVDDMNLDGAHVTSRLRETKYELRFDNGQWKISSYSVTSFGAARKPQE